MTDRRTALRQLGGGLFAAGAASLVARTPSAAQPPDAPDDPLQLLRDGNARFVGDAMVHPNQGSARRAELADGAPGPFAIVFSCIDSRTPPEIIFDRGLGDLLVVRSVAQDYHGLVANSVEYGPVTDATPLMVVMGHQRCATVTTAVEALESGTIAPSPLNAVVQAVKPAYLLAKATFPRDRAALVDTTIQARTHLAVVGLRTDPTLIPRLRSGRFQIKGAYYALDSGTVTWPTY